MAMWESARMLCNVANGLSEAVGRRESIVRDGLTVCQSETTPPPVCATNGYTADEWLWHWASAVPGTIEMPTAEDKRQMCVALVTRYMTRAKRKTAAG